MATITKTAKGATITFDYGTANVGAAFPFIVIYSTGGWNHIEWAASRTNVSNLPTFSKHKTLAAAHSAAAKHVAFAGGTYEVHDLT
jgi:hypothetical protein